MIGMAGAMVVRDRLVVIGRHLVGIAFGVKASLGHHWFDRLGRMRRTARPDDQENHEGGDQGKKAAHWGRVLSANAGQGEGGLGACAVRAA
jgi:hypothetical protein